MTVSLKHTFASAKPDGTDASQVQPSHWNAEHTLQLAGPALVGRSAAGTGPAAEVAIGSGLSLDGGTLSALETGEATSVAAGLMSAADKVKLDGVAASATANATDAALRDRTTHTGVQGIDTVQGLQSALDGKADSVHAHGIADVVGLQAALDSKATPSDVSTAVASLVGAAPATLDTLHELAAALGDDPNFATTMSAALGAQSAGLNAHVASISNPHAVTKAQVGLGNVDNTSDINKPVSTAQQAAIDSAVQAIPTATLGSAGLMSAQDKFNIQNMPSPQFLWAVTHARVPIVAHAGDSISYAVGIGGGNSMLTQALARFWPGRLYFGDDVEEVYQGSLSGTITDAANKIAVLTYDGAASTAAWFESKLMVGKWLYFPNNSISPATPATWQGRMFKVLGFDLSEKTVTVSYSNYIPASGQTAATTFPTVSGIRLSLSRGKNAYNIARGGATSGEILQYTLPIVQSWDPMPDLLILNGGTNDGDYTNTANNVIAFIQGARNAGVKLVAVMPMTPKDAMNDANVLRQFVYANAKIRNFVTQTDGCYLLDATSLFLDPQSATYQPIGASTGSYNATCVDGLHTSTRGAEAFAQVIDPLLQKMSGKRYPRALSHLDSWRFPDNLGGNVIESSGAMFPGTGGLLNNVTTPDVAQGWRVTTSTVDASTGEARAPVASIGTCDYVNGAGHRSQVFNLDGLRANASGDVIDMRCQRYDTRLFTGYPDYDAELVVKINATNLSEVGFTVSIGGAVSSGMSASLGSGGGSGVKDCSMIKPSNEWVFLFPRRPVGTNPFQAAVDFIISVKTRSNEPLAGTIEFAHAGVFSNVTT